MNNKLNKESIDLMFDKLASFINYIFPGLFVLELFFNKGFFSKQPETIMEGILFLIWCIVLSIPYHFIQPFSIYNFFNDITNELLRRRIVTNDDIAVDDDKFDDLKAHFEMIFIMLKILSIFFIYKLICFYWISCNYIGINQSIWKYICCHILMTIISYPVAFIYAILFRKILISYIYRSRK